MCLSPELTSQIQAPPAARISISLRLTLPSPPTPLRALCCQVADVSLSRALEMGSPAYTVVSTNPRWLAPEVLSGQPGQLPADVWAFGTVMWELMTWRLPFEDLNTFQVGTAVEPAQCGK